MESDSESALELLFAQDVPKKSRHVEIRLHWLRGKMHNGDIELKHCAGIHNCSDIFTKCLPSRDFWKHRIALGFVEQELPSGDLQSLQQSICTGLSAGSGQQMCFIEICCAERSGLREACRVAKMPYAGVIANVQDRRVLEDIQAFVDVQRGEFRWVHIHCSTPCSSGSPLKHFSDGSEPSASDLEWLSIMQSIEGYLILADSKSFELPVRNNIWKRPEAQKVLSRNGLHHFADVSLCQTGLRNEAGDPIGKKLRFYSTSACFSNYLTNKFGVCNCEKHADFNTVVWKQTGFYNRELSKAILAAARASRRDP